MKWDMWERIGVLMLSAALLCPLAGCGDDSPPESYTLGEETVTALPVPEDEEEVAFTAEEGEEEGDASTYTYDGLTDPGGISQTYVQELTGAEDAPFTLVDEDLVETEEPDYTASEGNALLARAGAESGTVSVLSLSWADGTCTVALDTREGEITQPAEETPEETAPADTLTLTGALDYIESLSPSQLGLEGTSMDEYKVYTMDGAVSVDGRACLKVKVYGLSEDDTNVIAGTFLISSDRLHVYRLDEAAGTVEEINP